MSRFLHRPMFRRGGSADGGITSGLRRGYADGNSVPEVSHRGMPTFKSSPSGSVFDLDASIYETPELPKSSAGADFWLNLGTSILAEPGGRPILQTLGTAGKEPLARYQQQRSQEDLLKYKHAQGERQFQLEIYKALTGDEKIALQKEIDYLMSEHGLTQAEALARAMPKYRKPRDPGEQKLLESEYERDQLNREIESIQSGLSGEGEYVTVEQARKIHKFYKQAEDQGWEYESDAPFIDKNAIAAAWRDQNKGKEHWLHPDSGNIAIPSTEQGTYDEGLYYVDHFTGDVYQVGPGSTELIKIDLDEIKIN